MSNFRRPKHLTTRRMQETRPNPPKEQAKAQRPAREIRWNCPAAAKCGGCQLTRLSYAEQLQWKQQRVAELLDGICEVRPILGMEDPFHYRNKVHAVLAVDKAGKPISGVYAMGTHRVVPVRHCLIEDRRADRIIQTIVAMLPAYKLRIYNEYTHRGFLRHILIRTGHVTGQIMVVLVATSLEFPGKKAFVQELIQRHPEITTVVLNCNQRETSMVLGTKEITLYGEGYMEDELCGKRFRISPKNVHAHVYGEHGDSSFVPWSLVHIANNHIDSYRDHSPDKDSIEWNGPADYADMEEFVKKSGAQVIKNKGATFYAVAVSVCHLCKCLQSTAGTALTVSTLMHGEYGVDDVCLSTLALVDRTGVRGKILNHLTEDEIAKLRHSADCLRAVIGDVEI